LLRYFRINDPYRLLALLVILLAIYLPLLINAPAVTFPELNSVLLGGKLAEGQSLYIQVVDQTAPLAAWCEGFFNMIFGNSLTARHIFSLVLIMIQATYLGVVFINKKAFSESTFIPSLIFIIFFSFSFDTLVLSPELIGSGFLLLALNNLFKEIEFREQRDESILNLGLYISVASLFSFSYSVYLIGSIVILAIFTRLELRKYLLLICGFLIPHLLLISIFFLRNGLPSLWNFYYLPNLSLSTFFFMQAKSLWMLIALPLLYLVVSFVMLNREARFTKYQSQLVQAMFFWMVFAVIQIFFSKGVRPQSFITLIPGACFYISHFLLMIRRRRFAEINLWILLIGVVSISYLSRYQKISSVRYDRLIVEDRSRYVDARQKKLLVLADDMAAYRNNQFASPFLNWNLSQEVFEHPEFYENVIRVKDSLLNDPPEVIVDPKNLLEPYLKRIPELRKHYRKTRPGEYQLVKAN
jgi:hypothetical protein